MTTPATPTPTETRAPARRDSTPTPALFTGWSPDEVDLIRRTIAPGATDYELALYLRLCRTYGLDPFRRELVIEHRSTPTGRVPIFITTRDGYLKAAMRDPGYAGIIAGVVRAGDHFEYDTEHFTVRHSFGATRGRILGAWAIAYHKHRPPMMAYVPFEEYDQEQSPTWRRYPTAMIQKVAEVFVLRRQYSVSGLVAREEIDEIDAPRGGQPAAQVVPAIPAPVVGVPTSMPGDDPAGSPGGAVEADAAGEPPRAETPETDPRAAPPARTDQGAQLGPDEKRALQTLISAAARAEGFSGRTPGQDWLERHYGARRLDALTDRLDEIREHALRIATDRRSEESAPAPARPAAPEPAPAPPTPPRPAPPRDEQASPEQLETIRHAFLTHGIVGAEQIAWVRQVSRRASIRSLDDLTAEEAERVRRSLPYLGPQRQTSSPPA